MQARGAPAAVLLVVIGAIRIAATWNVFSETADEPTHLACGLQILDEHQYSLQIQNPPLPRLLIAIGPWLAGNSSLVLARAGTLIFFVIASFATWLWARREFGDVPAIVALLLFTTQPSILGHAGLATLDVAGTAGFAVAMLAFSRWLEQPSRARAAMLGLAWGFAIACKLLCIAYVPLACGAAFLAHLARGARGSSFILHRSSFALLLVPPLAFLVVAATYGFDVDTLFRGIGEMMAVNREGFLSYAFGESRLNGWWWYFPVALALKTTLPFLALVALGIRRAWLPLAAAIAILAFAMTTHVNIGIRYILPIYVPLTLVAAMAVTTRARKLALVFVALHVIASFLAHPDYLAYFNALAGRDPSRYLIDSNLDWGQDTKRLGEELRKRKIDKIGVSLFGPADLDRYGFPPHYHLHPSSPAHGWIAVSDHSYRMSRTQGGWWWLGGKPYTRIGKSIRLYRLP